MEGAGQLAMQKLNRWHHHVGAASWRRTAANAAAGTRAWDDATASGDAVFSKLGGWACRQGLSNRSRLLAPGSLNDF